VNSRMITVGLSALAFAILVICVVGYLANPPGFDWSVAVDAGTAVGTTLLALATVWLALEARSEREHTRKLVELQEQDETRKDQAWVFVRRALVYFPEGRSNPRRAIAEVEVVNAGHGPAVEVGIALSVRGDTKPGSGKTNIGIETIPLMMPMSTELIRITPIKGSQPHFKEDVSKLICIDVQYRDKLTATGELREAVPFGEITSADIEDYYGAKKLVPKKY
jgi:hypothetical protein